MIPNYVDHIPKWRTHLLLLNNTRDTWFCSLHSKLKPTNNRYDDHVIGHVAETVRINIETSVSFSRIDRVVCIYVSIYVWGSLSMYVCMYVKAWKFCRAVHFIFDE